jgi:phytoene dehydrogenase-like protein
MPDAVVIGAGPNGLVAANYLADAGWDVLVLEAQPEPGGAVRTAQLTEPGFRHDVFSAFYPLAVASPRLAALELERHGLRWVRAPIAVAHPAPDGTCAAISRDLDETAASLDESAPGDGDAWRRLYRRWERLGPHFVDALLRPFPPVLPAARLAVAARKRELARFLRFAVTPVRRVAEEEFDGAGGARLLAGNALHADFSPETAGSGLFGWLLCGLAQQVGYPAPAGGAGRLADALVARLRERGGEVRCDAEVVRIEVRGGRAVGVETADGTAVAARRAVLADTGAPALFERLVGREHLPPGVVDDVRRFHWDMGAFKVDWALDGPIPWAHERARRAGTVHVGEDIDAMTEAISRVEMGLVPEHPILVMGQYASFDPTRAPDGAETAWAYTHVPRRVRGDAGGDGITGAWSEDEAAAMVGRVENEVERLAPGFRRLIRARHALTPPRMEAMDANLVGGAMNGGTAQIHQQLMFRPLPGLGRPSTPVKGLYLASSSAHPGGGVHGGPGYNAARAALWGHRARRLSVSRSG